ncbi:MAG: rod shape-determining protein MreC [Candidatus Omnitrophota bacterium]
MFFPKRKFISLLVFLFLVCFALVLSRLATTDGVRSLSADMTSLPLVALHAAAEELRAFVFFHRNSLENIRLRRENETLRSAVLGEHDLQSENERLRTLLDFKETPGSATIVASVIGKDFNALRPYLVIDKGQRAGVKKYAPVATPLGLVGKILEVGHFAAKLILINDPDLSVPAFNMRTGEQGLISGTLDGRCKLRFLDRDSATQVGDEIMTSGLNLTYPKGVLIGKVKWIGMEPSGVGKMAIIEPAVRISSLQEVLVFISWGHE